MQNYTPADHRRALDRLIHDIRNHKPKEPAWCRRCQDRPAIRGTHFCERCAGRMDDHDDTDPAWTIGGS